MLYKQNKHKFHYVTNVLTTTNKERVVVDPLNMPGLFLIKDPKLLKPTFTMRQIAKQNWYDTQMPLNPVKIPYKTKMRKISGSYTADGFYLFSFQDIQKQNWFVFEFENPSGLLHIFKYDPTRFITIQ
jgi:hypothetical protein